MTLAPVELYLERDHAYKGRGKTEAGNTRC